MKIYTIVAGVNGYGKSSLTGVLRTEIDNLGIIMQIGSQQPAAGIAWRAARRLLQRGSVL